MSWKILLHETWRREKPVETFIVSLPKKTQAKVAHVIDLLHEHGHKLGMPYSKQLSGGLYELRIRSVPSVRIFYTFRKMNIYLLHAFKKKTQNTPRKELETARKRLETLD